MSSELKKDLKQMEDHELVLAKAVAHGQTKHIFC